MSLASQEKRFVRFVTLCALVSAKSALSLFTPSCLAADLHSPPDGIPVSQSLPLGLPRFPPNKPVDSALIAYGEFLFQNPMLSRDGSMSCMSCHSPKEALSGPMPTAIGIGGATGRRHPPSIFNLYAVKSLMWDGRAPTLEQQIPMPLEQPSEMAIDWQTTLTRLSPLPATRTVLTKEGRAALDRKLVISALTSYVRSLVSGGSPFDHYYYGGEDDALSQDAKDGLMLFVRKGQCATCHLVTGYSAPFTDGGFHSVGIGFVNGGYKDNGRFEVTKAENDRGLFKTPSLRNVALKRYFMHDGSLKSLREVVEYYNRGGNNAAPNIDARLRPLFMSDHEIEQIVTFLQALSSPIQSYRATPTSRP